MRNGRTVVGFLGAFFFLVGSAASTAAPASLAIHTVEVQGYAITIRGENLVSDARTPPPTQVLLGAGMQPLPTGSVTATQITATLPPDLVAGSYLITVGFGLQDREFDHAWFTFGAVGPAGPRGDAGGTGPAGPPGPLVQCFEGDAVECYTGPASTRNVGQCRPGRRLCTAAGTWGTCSGQILPVGEVANGLDDDCNGVVDNGIALAQIQPSVSSLAVSEGGSGGFTVTLSLPPAGVVTVMVASSDTNAASVVPPSLQFTAANFHVPQSVNVTGVQDVDQLNESATVTLSAAGMTSRTVEVTVIDNDVQAIEASPTALAISPGSVASLMVRLSAQPAATTTVTVSAAGPVAILGPTTLTFTPANYAFFQATNVQLVGTVPGEVRLTSFGVTTTVVPVFPR